MSARRRAFLQWLAAGGTAPLAAPLHAAAASLAADSGRGHGRGRGHVRLEDAHLSLQFDDQLRSRIVSLSGGRAKALTGFDAGEQLVVSAPAEAKAAPPPMRSVERFALQQARTEAVSTPFGHGRSLHMLGRSTEGLEKQVTATLLDEHPGAALLAVRWRNGSTRPLVVHAWETAAHRLLPAPRHAGGWWSYSGASHADRRDWIQPVRRGFDQRNFMGMNATDYGGGTPLVDVWRRDIGLALGHLDTLPRLVSLPVRAHGDAVQLALRGEPGQALAPGETLETPTAFIIVHGGDFYGPLDRYRRLMARQGLVPPEPPASAHDAQWCAWGYEREFSLPLVRGTLDKVQELGLRWAVLDDGWQRRTGDWTPDPAKFPRGDADMKALVDDIHARGMKARLWIAPLAVAPGSDELHQHTDMLLLDSDGAVQDITWWNSFYLCPAYAKTQDRLRALVTKIIGEWGFDGLKVDGQHLNGVAPCHNKAHRHARPQEAVERLVDFYRVMHAAAHAANPEAVVEVCPCGTGYAFHNMPFMDQAPASDPLSSWQVRHKGKTLKALMGPWAAYAGDHVELSDGGTDFASSVGIGAVVATKFTWPVDPKPKDSFLLTPERERQWRQWIGLHNDKRLSQGRYRGELYDIAFDKPEAHAIEKDGAMHYAFYAPTWNGPVSFRGLGPGWWRLHDYVNGRDLGRVSADRPTLPLRFEHSLLVEARPEAAGAGRLAAAGRIDARMLSRDGFPMADAWLEAPVTHVDQDWRGQALAGPQATRVQMLNTADTLFVRFACRYAEITLFERELSSEAIYPLWERDVVEVFLQAPAERGSRRYRELEVSPNGLLLELDVDGARKTRVHGRSRARASINPETRSFGVELAIPLPASSPRDTWGINLYRVEGRQEPRLYAAWSPTRTPAPDFHVPEAFGRLMLDR